MLLPINFRKLLPNCPKDHFRNHIPVLGFIRRDKVRAAGAEFVNDMDPLPLKMVNSPKKDQFLIVHYRNYISYTTYKIYQKEKTSGTCLYFLLNS